MVSKAQTSPKATPPLDLLHHGLVGGILGLPLVVWLSGALVYYPASAAHDMATYQVTMWVVPAMWATVIGLAFMAKSKLRCWTWLLAGNAMAFTLLKMVQA